MIFVTGGTGFLGSHLLIELCKKGEKVRALRRETSDIEWVRKLFKFYKQESLVATIDWVEGDILDIHSLIAAMQDVEQVYHCAAQVSFSEKDKRKLIENNVLGTSNMVNAAIETGVKRLCHVSSIAVLGKDDIINDDTLWDNNVRHSAYAKSKYQAELEIGRGRAEGLEAFIVRPSVIIGPWNQNNGMGTLFQKIENGLNYYSPGSSAYVDVRDVAKAMIHLMNSPVKNESFIVSSENLTYREFFTMIAETLNKPAPQKCAGKFLTGLAWRFFAVKDFITCKDSGFTKIMAEIAQTTSVYSNKKLLDTLSFSYIPIKDSLSVFYNFYQFLSNENHEKIH